ncbi:MAG: hypothetical protein ACYC6T_15465, partial [Thermoleophilia bacterium]
PAGPPALSASSAAPWSTALFQDPWGGSWVPWAGGRIDGPPLVRRGPAPPPAASVLGSLSRSALHYSVDTDQFVLALTDAAEVQTLVQAATGWESGAASLPTPGAPGVPIAGARLSAAASMDGSYLVTGLASIDRSKNSQLLRFQVGAGVEETLTRLALIWRGHGEPTPTYDTQLYLWDFSTGSWESLGSRFAPNDVTIAGSYDFPTAGFCRRCHDGAPPPGVVLPVSLPNIGPLWDTGGSGDFHGDRQGTNYAHSAGTVSAPYRRGSAGVACSVCHDPHGSGNIFHLRGSINGSSPLTVTVGTQIKAACAACHGGTVADWHVECLNCHSYGPGHGSSLNSPETTTNVGYPNESSNCLLCHNHGSKTYVGSSTPTGLRDVSCSWHSCHNYSTTF